MYTVDWLNPTLADEARTFQKETAFGSLTASVISALNATDG